MALLLGFAPSPPASLATPIVQQRALSSRLPWRCDLNRRINVCAAAAGDGDDNPVPAEEDYRRSGPFWFVTDNESSRNAIDLPGAMPALDGNVGAMIWKIKDKGQDYGKLVKVGEFNWFIRETGLPTNGTIVLLHGAPSHSYSYVGVMTQMAEAGYRCIAPDWLGFGLGQAPQPGSGFPYTEEAYHEELDKVLAEMKVESPFILVTQGFLVGSYGLTWALKNHQELSKLVILNTPLTVSAPLPWLFTSLRFPLVGEVVSQNALMAERFIEKGSPYVLPNEKADVYRLPYLRSSGPGFALLEAARKAPLDNLSSAIFQGFKSWRVPTLVAWGEDDKFLPTSEAIDFAKVNPDAIRSILLPEVGHIPQEDWPEKVVEAIKGFL